MLRSAEVVTAFTLALTAESVAAGLQLLNSGGYETYYASNLFSFWMAVDPTRRQQAVFAAGVTLGIELTIVSNEPGKPSRIRNRTFGVKVVSQ